MTALHREASVALAAVRDPHGVWERLLEFVSQIDAVDCVRICAVAEDSAVAGASLGPGMPAVLTGLLRRPG